MPVPLNYGLHVLLEVVAKNVQVSVAFYKQSHFWNQSAYTRENTTCPCIAAFKLDRGRW